MTRVQGNLKIVTGAADDITEVWVRAARARPVTGGWLMTADGHHPVSGGVVDLELLPGACVLVAVTAGEPGEKVEMIVPDSGTASLEACIRAAESAGELERAALDELRQDMAAWIDEARKSVARAESSEKAASASAKSAASSADTAKGSATAAAASSKTAAASETAAGASATAAAGSASAAKADAGKAASSATAAGRSATAAKTDADRAANVAASTSWSGDKLTVNGKTSPSLTGPRGEKGAPGESGASTWDTVSGKPSEFPPEPHKHTVADITDLPKVSPYGDPNTIMQRSSSGHAILNMNATPTSSAHVTHKKYVDDQDRATLAEVKALMGSRPAFFSGSGAPPSSIPGAVVGDYYLDETTMELHKITGV